MRAQSWDFMVKDTPARDWSEGMGALIAVAFFCGGIAGGLYLLSLYFNNPWGMFIGWVFALGMGLFDMAHLGNKLIAWRIAFRFRSSWISRGFLFVTLFIGSAAIQMALTHWAPGTAAETFFKVVAGITALGVAAYSGFVVSYVSCIKFWHSTIMPVLFVVTGLAGGAAILLVINSISGFAPFSTMRVLTLGILLTYLAVIGLQLSISTYNSATAKSSVMTIVKGSAAGIFWSVVVFIGIIVPLAITFFTSSSSPVWLGINALCVLSGNLALRYTILRAGMYSSLLPL